MSNFGGVGSSSRIRTRNLETENLQLNNVNILTGSFSGSEIDLNDIETSKGDISNIQSDVSTAQGDISTLQSNVSNLTSDVSTAQSNISTLQSGLNTTNNNLSTLQTNFSNFQTSLSGDEGLILENVAKINQNENDISNLQTDVSTAQGDISTLQSNLNNTNTTVSTAQGNISTLQSNVSTLTSDLSTAQGNISTLQSDLNNTNTTVSIINNNFLDKNSSSPQTINGTLNVPALNVDGNELIQFERPTIEDINEVVGIAQVVGEVNNVLRHDGDIIINGSILCTGKFVGKGIEEVQEGSSFVVKPSVKVGIDFGVGKILGGAATGLGVAVGGAAIGTAGLITGVVGSTFNAIGNLFSGLGGSHNDTHVENGTIFMMTTWDNSKLHGLSGADAAQAAELRLFPCYKSDDDKIYKLARWSDVQALEDYLFPLIDNKFDKTAGGIIGNNVLFVDTVNNSIGINTNSISGGGFYRLDVDGNVRFAGSIGLTSGIPSNTAFQFYHFNQELYFQDKKLGYDEDIQTNTNNITNLQNDINGILQKTNKIDLPSSDTIRVNSGQSSGTKFRIIDQSQNGTASNLKAVIQLETLNSTSGNGGIFYRHYLQNPSSNENIVFTLNNNSAVGQFNDQIPVFGISGQQRELVVNRGIDMKNYTPSNTSGKLYSPNGSSLFFNGNEILLSSAENFLPLTGGILSGNLNVNGDILSTGTIKTQSIEIETNTPSDTNNKIYSPDGINLFFNGQPVVDEVGENFSMDIVNLQNNKIEKNDQIIWTNDSPSQRIVLSDGANWNAGKQYSINATENDGKGLFFSFDNHTFIRDNAQFRVLINENEKLRVNNNGIKLSNAGSNDNFIVCSGNDTGFFGLISGTSNESGTGRNENNPAVRIGVGNSGTSSQYILRVSPEGSGLPEPVVRYVCFPSNTQRWYDASVNTIMDLNDARLQVPRLELTVNSTNAQSNTLYRVNNNAIFWNSGNVVVMQRNANNFTICNANPGPSASGDLQITYSHNLQTNGSVSTVNDYTGWFQPRAPNDERLFGVSGAQKFANGYTINIYEVSGNAWASGQCEIDGWIGYTTT